MTYFLQLDTLETLCREVSQQNPIAGSDGLRATHYPRPEELAYQLYQELVDASYTPQPYLRFYLSTPQKKRPIDLPAFRDRVLMKYAQKTLKTHLHFHHHVYGIPSKGWQHALTQIESQLHHTPALFALKVDIHSFFESIQPTQLKTYLNACVDPQWTALIMHWLNTPSIYKNQLHLPLSTGIPQGLPLSNELAHLYLSALDEWIDSHSQITSFRYLDDFLFLHPDLETLKHFQTQFQDWLSTPLTLKVNPRKIQIDRLNDGRISYLGHTFQNDQAHPQPQSSTQVYIQGTTRTSLVSELALQVYKAFELLPQAELESTLKTEPQSRSDLSTSALTPQIQDYFTLEIAQSNPTLRWYHTCHLKKPLRTLYLLNTPARLRLDRGALLIQPFKNGFDREVPLEHVGQIVAFGPIEPTSAVIQYVLRENIPVLILSSEGEYYGRFDSTNRLRGTVIKAQYRFQAQEHLRLHLAKCFVRGRLTNARILLVRNLRNLKKRASSSSQVKQLSALIQRLKRQIHTIESAQDLDQLRGIEGSSTQLYWQGYGLLFDSTWNFKGRNRRPPQDPINSLLSFLSVLLSYNIYSILELCGLSPYVGILHSDQSGRPAFAFDLIEEFRAPIAESAVLMLCKNQQLTPDDFEQKETRLGMGTFIKRSAMPIVIKEFERAISREIRHPLFGLKGDYRRMIHLQVLHCIACLKEEAEYHPFKIR